MYFATALLALLPSWEVPQGTVEGTSVVLLASLQTRAELPEGGAVTAPLALKSDQIEALRGASVMVKVSGAPVTVAVKRTLMGSAHMSGVTAQPSDEWQEIAVTTDMETEMTPRPPDPNAAPQLELVIFSLGDAAVDIGEVTTW